MASLNENAARLKQIAKELRHVALDLPHHQQFKDVVRLSNKVQHIGSTLAAEVDSTLDKILVNVSKM